IKASRKYNAEQWSKEERYSEEYLKNEERISVTNAIESDIALEFYRNLEHKDNYKQSSVEYNGKKVYIIFYDWRQNPLRRLADYFYSHFGTP
ncbi:unnamed protein product, partial [marine sediment metagenome]